MILVTGGTGLVGSHLLYHLLLENDSVRAIHQRNSDLNAVKRVFQLYVDDADRLFNKIRWVEASLNDITELEKAFENVRYVYHCAAIISFASKDYQIMRKVNIHGTTNVVNLCISNQVDKLCFVSSVAAIENGAEGELMDETDNWNNAIDKSGYAITKYGAEMEVWRASQEGIPVVIVNPGVILGSGFLQKGSGTLFSNVQKGLKFYTEGITGFVGVQDVVKVMMRLMASTVINERYILISENLSYKNVLFMMADALGKQRPKIRINKLISAWVWRLEFLRSKISLSTPLLTKYTAKSALSNHPYTAQKIKNELNFEFEPIKSAIERVARDLDSQTY
ncbi:NAD-dependent epimerase/dehydratase family protein [Lutimonas sp.]|uniref:NAD-dependent epimerase/dehydratase family protein n=1 Tax=Lutimonas sp. TaxID=1872403 RepID=UPI003C71AE2C